MAAFFPCGGGFTSENPSQPSFPLPSPPLTPSSHLPSPQTERTTTSETQLPKPRDFDPKKHEKRFITSITFTFKKAINVPLVKNDPAGGDVTLKVSLDESREGEKSIPGVRTDNGTNVAFSDPVTFTSKELGTENLDTYTSVNVVVMRGEEEAGKVTVQIAATSSTVEAFQLEAGGTVFFDVKKGLENYEGTRQRAASLRIERRATETKKKEEAVGEGEGEGGEGPA